MFFMIGIGQREAELPLDQTCVCPVCGRFGRLQVRMSYTCLTLFFLPVLKWGIRYAASMGCCGAGCELDPQLGRRLACGRASYSGSRAASLGRQAAPAPMPAVRL